MHLQPSEGACRFRSPFVAATLILLAVFGRAAPASADSCAPLLAGVTSASLTSTITLNGVNSGRSVDSTALSSAAGAWNNACSAYGNPSFQTSGAADMTANVHFYNGTDASNGFSCGGKCGCTDTQITNGAVSGATVRMFGQQANGASCLGSQNEILTHELGHVLGLGDSSCSGRIMGDLFGSIASGDCAAVDGNFLTDEERQFDRDDPIDGPCAV